MFFAKKLFSSAAVAVALASLVCAGACGGKNGEAKTSSAEKTMDDDPIMLLPAPAVAVVMLDSKALAAHPAFGKDLVAFEDKYVPMGEEAGFKASRDIDRVYFATYSLQGADALGVLVGRFDEAKVKEAAKAQVAKYAGAFVTSPYGGREIHTMNNVGFATVSSKLALCGTEAAIRRALDRVRDKKTTRDIDSWMIQTIETAGAAFAGAGDMSVGGVLKDVRSPIMPIEGIMQMTHTRVVGNFKEPGINVTAAVTYPDEAKAQLAKEQMEKLKKFLPYLTVVGIPGPQDLQIKNEKADVQVTFGLEGAAISNFLVRTAPQLIPPGMGRVTSPVAPAAGADAKPKK